jgi:hypothetical protein
MAETLQEKLRKKRQKIKERSSGGNVTFLKEGTTRIRILPVGEDEDWSFEMIHFYLGNEIKGVFSAASLGKPCPIMEHYQKLKETDKNEAKKIAPRNKALVVAIVYDDETGKKIDEEKSGKLLMVPSGILSQMIDLFLDPDAGDFTDPVNGYDLKIRRTGKGKLDTEYTLSPVRNSSSIPEKWRKEVDLRKLVEGVILPYEEAENKLVEYLATASTDDDEDEAPRKSSSEKSGLKKRRKVGRGDE